MTETTGRKVGVILSARWWIGLGVLATVTIGVVELCRQPPVRPPEQGWLQELRADLERLPEGPANSLRVGQGEVFELEQVDRLLFHLVLLEPDSTLKLAGKLQELRARRIELNPGASILGVGRAGSSGETGRAGANGSKCTNGQDGTDGTSGGNGGDGIDIRLETLLLAAGGIVTIDTSAGGGGTGGAGGVGGSGGRGDRSERCDGGDGGSGGRGGDGGSGGTAGDLQVRFGELRSLSNEELSVNDLRGMLVHVARPGLGGAPGEGGAGGGGGRGRGADIFGHSADAGSRGNNGQTGNRGTDGQLGTTTFGDAPVDRVSRVRPHP